MRSFQRENEKRLLINWLNRLGIKEAADGKDLRSVDYYSLRRLLAVERAIRS